jgi:hypothetical protein
MDPLKAADVQNVKIVAEHAQTAGILVIVMSLPYVIQNSVFVISVLAEFESSQLHFLFPSVDTWNKISTENFKATYHT